MEESFNETNVYVTFNYQNISMPNYRAGNSNMSSPGSDSTLNCINNQPTAIAIGENNSITNISNNILIQGSCDRVVYPIPDFLLDNNNNIFVGVSCHVRDLMNIPESVVCIGKRACFGMHVLENVVLPNHVHEVCDEAFAGCISLKMISLGLSLTSIGCRAFKECTSLRNTELPDTLTNIGNRAFEYCSNIRMMHIPDGVNYINEMVFHGCKSIISLRLPPSLGHVDYSSFGMLENVQSLMIPNNGIRIFNEETLRCNDMNKIAAPLWEQYRRMTEGSDRYNGSNPFPRWLQSWLFMRSSEHYTDGEGHRHVYDYCYYFNKNQSLRDDIPVLMETCKEERINNDIEDGKDPFRTRDNMNMYPLHVLCCNFHATYDDIRTLYSYGNCVNEQYNLVDNCPLVLYLKTRYLMDMNDYFPGSAIDIIKKGINYESMQVVLILKDLTDEMSSTTMFRLWMAAASTSSCTLDTVYLLAMHDICNVRTLMEEMLTWKNVC